MRLERLVAIIMVLLERDKVRARELAELFEVSVRTIYRDLEAINIAGIPILTLSGPNGGVSIMKEYKFEKRIFTASDITTMLMGLGFLSNTLSSEEVKTTLAKIQSFIPKDRIHEITMKSAQMAFDLSSWMGNEGLKVNLELIKASLESQQVLSFAYMDRSGHKTKRMVEGFRLLLKENNWYFQGYCQTRNDFRTFKLSRMSELELTTEIYQARTVPPGFLTGSYDVSERMTTAKLLVKETVIDRLLDYCSPADLEVAGAGQYRLDFSFTEDDYGYGLILSLGDKCVCLGPERVRLEIKKRIEKALESYL